MRGRYRRLAGVPQSRGMYVLWYLGTYGGSGVGGRLQSRAAALSYGTIL